MKNDVKTVGFCIPKNQYIVIHPQKMRKKCLIFFQLEVENQKLLLLSKTVTPLKCGKTTEEDVLLGVPHPFGVLPSLRLKNDPLFNMDHVYMKCDFLNFIETEETHAEREHSQVCKKQNGSKKSGPIQKFDKHGYCTEFSEYKDRCHNVIYGQYCIDACI